MAGRINPIRSKGVRRVLIAWFGLCALWGTFGFLLDGWQSNLAWAAALERGDILLAISQIPEGARVGDQIAQSIYLVLLSAGLVVLLLLIRWIAGGFAIDRSDT